MAGGWGLGDYGFGGWMRGSELWVLRLWMLLIGARASSMLTMCRPAALDRARASPKFRPMSDGMREPAVESSEAGAAGEAGA